MKALFSVFLHFPLLFQTLKLIVSEQLNYGMKVISPTSEKRNETALVIDGHSLAVVAAYPELESLFIELASFCESVLCCRVSPKQKATVMFLLFLSLTKISQLMAVTSNRSLKW